jgi:predicted nucleic acid-binding protein
MQWLLDTCVLSELTRKKPESAVLAWLADHGREAAMTVVSVGELQYGIERLAAGRQRNALQLWFDGLCGQYAGRMLAADDAVWRAFARLKASVESIGRPQEDLDLLIAATATVHQLTLVTRNTRHFEDSGVRMLNPWPVP